MTETENLVDLVIEGPTAWVTMTNANGRNSLSLSMIEQLISALDQARNSTTIKSVILAADGPVFCAGHDLKEMRRHKENDNDAGRAYYDELFKRCGELMISIVRFPVPIIARVQGIATAAGCQLVASCDLAYAVDDAQFATPGVNIGLFCSTPMVALSRNVSNKHTMEMLLTGDMISSRKAKEIGLINAHVPTEQLDTKVKNIAQTIAAKARYPVKVGKEAFYQQSFMELEDAYAYTAKVMADNMMNADAKEGIGAFLDKRHPVWSDEL